MAEKSAYAILNVKKDASDEEIKRAYIDLVKRFDPEMHTERFMQIQKAYECLSDPRMRAREDLSTFNTAQVQFSFTTTEREFDPAANLDMPIEQLVARGTEVAQNAEMKTQFVDMLMKRSFRHVKARAWREAIKDWKVLLKVDPAYHRARNNLTCALIQLGYSYALHELFEEAAQAWESALLLNPENVAIIHNLGLAYEKANLRDKAQKYWQELVRHWKNDLAKNPDDVYLKERVVEALKSLGDQAMDKSALASKAAPASQAAQKQYGEALQIAPDDFKAQYQMAVSLMTEKKFKDAAERLRTLNAQHPKNIEVLNLMGWALLNSNDHERGFQTWRRALTMDPANHETRQSIIKARMQLAQTLRERGQYTYALVHYKELQRLLPDSEEVIFEIAETLKSKGDKRAAEREYRRVVEKNPGHKAATKALSEIRMGH
ncbi:MAG: tetratricopeptide repeat protein [Candidatus Sumerlaeota bacterium]|nr:tetratricopeptide repeat protein [Candidatus Sumerlaeota bacterium]